MNPTQTIDLLTRVARGSIPGITDWRMNAYGGLTTTHLPLWHEGTAYTFLQANMSSPTVSSSSANDTAAGTGARTVRVSGVNASFVRVTEDVTMNGTTAVALVKSYMTIDSMIVLTAGSGLTNAGNIYAGTGLLTAGKPTVVHARMSIGTTSTYPGNIAQQSWYATPANVSLYITSIRCGGPSATASGNVLKLDISTNLGLLKNVLHEGFSNPGEFNREFKQPIAIPPKTQLIFSALASAGGPIASLQASGFLVDETNNVGGLAVQ